VDAEVGIEAVEFCVAGFPGEADGSGEKPAVGRAFAVVEAIVRFVGLGIGDGVSAPVSSSRNRKP
jgi:hypothetical protein